MAIINQLYAIKTIRDREGHADGHTTFEGILAPACKPSQT